MSFDGEAWFKQKVAEIPEEMRKDMEAAGVDHREQRTLVWLAHVQALWAKEAAREARKAEQEASGD